MANAAETIDEITLIVSITCKCLHRSPSSVIQTVKSLPAGFSPLPTIRRNLEVLRLLYLAFEQVEGFNYALMVKRLFTSPMYHPDSSGSVGGQYILQWEGQNRHADFRQWWNAATTLFIYLGWRHGNGHRPIHTSPGARCSISSFRELSS